MRNLFTALKQDTHANHAILENTFPFSMYHKDNVFNDEDYLAILRIMRVFHQTTVEAVEQAVLQNPAICRVASMINREEVLLALSNDTRALSSSTLPTSAFSKAPHTNAYNPLSPVGSSNNEEVAKLNLNTKDSCFNFNTATSQAIAAIYVWLGSSMGANIIVRRLEASALNIPTEYYQAMSGCAKSWVSFKQEAESLLTELGLDNERFISDTVKDANTWFEFLISLGSNTSTNPTLVHRETEREL